MASNRIKNLIIDINDVYEKVAEAITECIENITVEGIGDDQNTSFDIESVTVEYKNGQFVANIDLQRTEGKFCSNQDIEDAVISEINNQKMTVEVEIGA